MGARTLICHRAPSALRPGTGHLAQARRDSNPQPPVLETGALPIELRTSVLNSARPRSKGSGQGQSRTADTAVFSRVLYHLSYLANHTKIKLSFTNQTPQKAAFGKSSGGRIRTCDLRVMSPTSYLTAPPRNKTKNLPFDVGGVNPSRR